MCQLRKFSIFAAFTEKKLQPVAKDSEAILYETKIRKMVLNNMEMFK